MATQWVPGRGLVTTTAPSKVASKITVPSLDWSFEGLGRSNLAADAEFAAAGRKVLSKTKAPVVKDKPKATAPVKKAISTGTLKAPPPMVLAATPEVTGIPVPPMVTPLGLSMGALNSQYTPEQLGGMNFSGYQAGSLGTDYNGTPQGLSMNDAVSKFSPEQLGGMDFSTYDAGSLGSTPKGNWDNFWDATGETGTGLAGMASGFGEGVMGTGKDLWNGIGGAEGFSNLGSGLSSLYGMYSAHEANKRADDAMRMYKSDRNAAYASNDKWNKGLAGTTLGTGTREVLGA
jgi:hypothetical protein